jgi:hypothetical protein
MDVVSVDAHLREDAMARARRRQIASINDANFEKIENELECELPATNREWILLAIGWAPFFKDMQTDLESTIFQVADDIARHAPKLERALTTAARSPHISHWLSSFAYGDLNELGLRPQALVEFVAAQVSAFKKSAKIVQTMPRRGRGRTKLKDRELLSTSLTKALRAIPSFPECPTVTRFAHVMHPYLTNAPTSKDALADLLIAELGQEGRKNRRKS